MDSGLAPGAGERFLTRTPAPEVLATDAIGLFQSPGLSEHLTLQRSNGMRSRVERIRSDTRLEALATA